MTAQGKLPECPVAVTVKVIGGKWKILVLRNLLERPHCFNEMLRSFEGCNQKTLTQALRALERDGIVARVVYPGRMPKVEYSLTELGRSLEPIIVDMARWGEEYRRLSQGRDVG